MRRQKRGKKKKRKIAKQKSERQMTAKQKSEKQKMRLQMLRLQEGKGSSLRVLGKENYERFIDLQLPRIVDPD
jgi:hypothetical protein